jgi:hypothetical protein
MTYRLFTLVAVTALIVGCASKPPPQPMTSLLVGADSSSARVRIKSVDNGPTLWASRGELTTRATITPGRHMIEVVCESEGALHFAPGAVIIDVLPGHTYDLTGSMGPGATRCNVSATTRS